jgi:hypothetical protein
MRVVAISSNGAPDYEPLVPLTVAAWKACGWDCAVLRPDDGLASTAQLMRLFAPLNYSDDTLVMMGDADLIPLSPETFDEISEYDIFSYGWNLVAGNEVPMCHTGALACYWREFMGYDRWPGNTLSERARAMLADFRETHPGADPWSADQMMLASRIRRAPCAWLSRETGLMSIPLGRYDRANGLASCHPPAVDMHCRPHQMPRILQILEQHYGRRIWEPPSGS